MCIKYHIENVLLRFFVSITSMFFFLFLLWIKHLKTCQTCVKRYKNGNYSVFLLSVSTPFLFGSCIISIFIIYLLFYFCTRLSFSLHFFSMPEKDLRSSYLIIVETRFCCSVHGAIFVLSVFYENNPFHRRFLWRGAEKRVEISSFLSHFLRKKLL